MLYPEKARPFDEKQFRSPGNEYRAAPFWAWNNRLNVQELCWQIERLKEMGFGGFHMHVRTGLETPYLSDEYMQVVQACVNKARREGMRAYLYDEDRWPSGGAGGLVTKNQAHRQRTLLLSRDPPGEGVLLCVYDVCLNEDGTLCTYRKHRNDSRETEYFTLYASMQIMKDNPWHNNQAYLDTLSPKSVQAFIHTTYDRYNAWIADEFGSTVPSIFTDEPQFAGKETLRFARDTRAVSLPWTTDLPQTYGYAYGEDLLAHVPELLWDLPEGRISVTRYRYHDHLAERFAAAFADQCGAWCEQHGLSLTGHMMSEPTLKSQTMALGEAMRSYRAFQLPGIDVLCDLREYTTAKQAQSAARQYGREGVLSELYGVTNWNFDFRSHKLQGDWQAALGVTLRVPHLAWVSMHGEAKRDYPASINYQSPWYRQYRIIEDHFARLNTVLTRGDAQCRVGVLHPVESYWLHWGASENTASVREQKDEQFAQVTEWLLRGLIDFDFICESLLCFLQPALETGLQFQVGNMAYDVVLVPGMETMRGSTLARLKRFADNGGRVIFMGDIPTLVDAVPSSEPVQLAKQCRCIPFERMSLLEALQDVRDIEARDADGAMTNGLLYQLRREGECYWLFLCHADPPINQDIPTCEQITLRVRGSWQMETMDTLTGNIHMTFAEIENGWTQLDVSFYEEDSLLLRLSPGGAVMEKKQTVMEHTTLKCRFLDPVHIRLHEPNVLLLDQAEYRLNGERLWHEREEILRLDQQLRQMLRWPLRGEAYPQPWAVPAQRELRRIHLRYRVESSVELNDVRLALENADGCDVELNGKEAVRTEKWYVDKCIQVMKLPTIHAGINILEISRPYGPATDLEACYLLGDFCVGIEGSHAVLLGAKKNMCFGDITRMGYPFYGGNLTWDIQAELETGTYELQMSEYRGSLIRVALDGVDVGMVVFSPYRLRFAVDWTGRHQLSITLYGTRINTFGQVHHVNKQTKWWGPDSWRSSGCEWAYEYHLWPQGILKSPELFRVEDKIIKLG